MRILLGDLFHTWSKGGVWTIPLNVGYVASYTKKMLKINESIDCDVQVFKDANKIIDAIKKYKPQIVGLGFFVWNEKINKFVFDYIKENYPKILTVGGGPRFTNINANLKGAQEFFNQHNSCDVFVINQGEKGFYKVAKTFIEKNYSIKDFKETNLPGSLVNNINDDKIKINTCENHIHVGENIGTLDDLNEIPSPYLTGLLDPFFEDRWMPILETNRSCPYRCTFCAWGIGTQKLQRFNEERVMAEIDYIAKRSKKSKTVYIADANFGILERDAKFAKKMYETHVEYGWPFNVAVQWNKTRPDRVYNVAKEFKGIAPVGASMQSFDPDVLESVKRKNLTVEQIIKLQEDLSKIGVSEKSFSELIIGLPNETKKSHIEANRKLIDLGFEIWNYNLHLLPGTEMNEENYRKKYFKKTGYRLHDNSFGIYNYKNTKIFEAQETVLETSSLSTEDFRYFRFFHFILQMMWSKKWYYEFLIFLKNDYNLHPVDFADEIINQLKKNKNNKISNLYNDFMRDYDEAESFETYEDLVKYWQKDENFERLKNGEYGKLNMLYTYKIVLDLREEFSEFLLDTVKVINTKKKIKDKNIENKCRDILKFQNLKIIKFSDNNDLVDKYKSDFDYDILMWIKNKYKNLEKVDNKINYNFFVSQTQKNAIMTQLKENKSKNINSKFRDMSVYTSTNQFFYSIEKI
jgi:radical SAM superfamily enzyme YgiQ (UPF0313 family)